jgi:hypothetical protein
MARPKTPKQLEIKINSLKKQVGKLEQQKKKADIAAKKKAVKKKVVKRKPAKKKAAKKRKRR